MADESRLVLGSDGTPDTDRTFAAYAQRVSGSDGIRREVIQMKLRSILVSLALGVVAVTGVWARQASPAQLAFEAAKDVEVNQRDLNAAIVRYRAVASAFPKDLSLIHI